MRIIPPSPAAIRRASFTQAFDTGVGQRMVQRFLVFAQFQTRRGERDLGRVAAPQLFDARAVKGLGGGILRKRR